MDLSECKVLIVDDTPANIDVLAEALGDGAGHHEMRNRLFKSRSQYRINCVWKLIGGVLELIHGVSKLIRWVLELIQVVSELIGGICSGRGVGG